MIIKGKKIFDDLLITLREEVSNNESLSEKYNLDNLDKLNSIRFDKRNGKEIIEVMRQVIQIYEDACKESLSPDESTFKRNVNKIFR